VSRDARASFCRAQWSPGRVRFHRRGSRKEERLQLLLRQTAHLPADGISARISAEMKNGIRDAEQYDDLTFIVMKVR
jgi:serine phosphatase RsbU (regulator of sigma subunit)